MERLVLQLGRQRIVPSIEKAKHADHRHDFGLLAFRIIDVERRKMLIGRGVGNLARRKCKIQRCAFCFGKKITGLIVPYRPDLGLINAGVASAQRCVRLAILTTGHRADHGLNQAFETI